MDEAEVRAESPQAPRDMAQICQDPGTAASLAASKVSPQVGVGSCPTCGGTLTLGVADGITYPYVYALGRIEPRYPSIAVEKELAQATGRAETANLTDRQALQSVLSQRSNRYLVRQLCWVLTIEGLDTYLLQPHDSADFDLLTETLRTTPSPADIDAVIGMRGSIAPAEMCNGLMIPIVVFDQVYSFDRDSLVKGIPRPKAIPEEQEEQFRATAEELFDRIVQMTDNAGATDEDRALNYLALRYPRIYEVAAEAHAGNSALTAVEAQPSRLSTTRKIIEVVFTYTNRANAVDQKYFARVDVTEEFPFLITPLSPYYDR